MSKNKIKKNEKVAFTYANSVLSEKEKYILFKPQSKYFRIYLTKQLKHLYSENLEVSEKELTE